MIHLEDISKTYSAKGRHARALDGIDLTIRKGEVFGIIGRSGAGKSTLIRMLNLLESPSTGKIWVDGQDITTFTRHQLYGFRQKVGMVFQHFNLLTARTVLDNVCFPLRLAKVPLKERRARALEMLELVGLQEHVHKYPRQLSGGQQQRVGIARALANRPDLLLCDEATSALDPETTQSILRLLRSINQDLGITIVLITHGMDVIRSVCDRVAVIDAGKIVELGEVVDVFLHPTHSVTRSLLNETGVDPEGWRVLAQQTPGTLLRLSFRGEASLQPILSQITRELNVDVSILQGAVSRIKDEPYGQLVVAVPTEPDSLAALRLLLQQANIDVELLRS
ncbi:methionine ABC transporter ATP-binding protein [Alcaligenes endophyticus]|uniref:ATP-binding cassette domain-containing protein n=1 Tax=Alcaligenes endophyticus TaxID=1929088 RepID=A0ABT8EMQ7_9BURK|nr:ATP-binding cassette domain-containing protein [Alcaligenes endophyticus]MCX5591560.1 ATP-binding cassette domain-containing protein [Alcaligenes endophyticus]MDN4122559.1 ATP-binding cassette domain-containing protein [Alcaligenes endophyticus]